MHNIIIYFKNILYLYNKIFLYHNADVLMILWFFLSLFLFFCLRITTNIYQIGMLESTKYDARFELKADGKKKKKNTLKYLSYDAPTNKILFLRTLGVILNNLTIILILINVTFLTISTFIYYLEIDFINLNYLNFYLFSSNNIYGICCILLSIVIAYITYFMLYNLYMKLFFSEVDKHINEEMIASVNESGLRKGKLLDVKDLKFNKVGLYDPMIYFDDAYSNNSLFLGLDDSSNPIYYNKDTWNETNVQIVGKMGSGKGVLATIVFIQCYKNYNDFNVWFDPKNDEWAYSVFKTNIDEKEFFYIDLNRSAEPQFNIFDGIDSVELNELFVAGFGLGRTGTNADFYRIGDRKACRELANQFKNNETININTIMKKWKKLPKKIKENAANFYGQLEELAELKCIQTNKGINLAELIKNNQKGMLYITGTLRDENVIMLQKMLLLRLTQLIEKRNRLGYIKHINIMLDEVRYILSKSTLEMMGTIRDKKANITYTHQSLGDLVGASQDLDPISTKNLMLDNVGLRWIYKLDIKESAEWASDLTSETLKDVERRTLSMNDSNVEMISKETSIYQQKTNYIETSVIQNLPNRCGVLIGIDSLPKLAYSSPIIVNKLEKVICSAPALKMTSLDAIEDIDNKFEKDIGESNQGLMDFLSSVEKNNNSSLTETVINNDVDLNL